MTRRKVDASLKLAARLSVPASITTPETAQAEAERWVEKRRIVVNRASATRLSKLHERAIRAGATGWSEVESAVIDGVITLPNIPAWYKPRRGPKKSVK